MAHRDIETRGRVKRRSRGRCEICGTNLLLVSGGSLSSQHHRFKQEYGGKDSIVNLLDLCLDCHRGIHENEMNASQLGYIAEYPEMTPVFLRGHWYVLTEDGKKIPITKTEFRKLMPKMVGLYAIRDREIWRAQIT